MSVLCVIMIVQLLERLKILLSTNNFTLGIILTGTLFAGAVVSTSAQADAGSIFTRNLASNGKVEVSTPRQVPTHLSPAYIFETHGKKTLQQIMDALDNAEAHVSDVTVVNDALTELRTDISLEVSKQRNLISNSISDTLTFPRFMLTTEDMDQYAESSLAKLDILMASYDSELAAETARIAEAQAAAQAAEAARLAAEAAQRVAAQTKESQEARLQRIAAEVGVTVPVVIQEGCGGLANVLGCFNLPGNYINVTQLGLSRGDAKLRCILMHENRHAWQYATGFLEYLPGETDTEWRNRAEADAVANSCSTS
jgi:hypothetical protein